LGGVAGSGGRDEDAVARARDGGLDALAAQGVGEVAQQPRLEAPAGGLRLGGDLAGEAQQDDAPGGLGHPARLPLPCRPCWSGTTPRSRPCCSTSTTRCSTTTAAAPPPPTRSRP